MKKLASLLGAVLVIVSLHSCKKGRLDVDVSGIDVDTDFIRFDQLLFSVSEDNFKNDVVDLSNQHTNFFNLFTYRMIRIGGMNDKLFFDGLSRFLKDTMILNVKNRVDHQFRKISKTENQVNEAFRHYKYYFPEKKIPEIYTCISGFNQSIVVAPGLIGVSLDKYLGPETSYYNMLAIPKYKQQKMVKERIPVDLMYGWAASEFIKTNKETNLLSSMVYEGKLLYFLDAMFPKMPDTLKIGYSEKQLDWCERNEAQMWLTLVEEKRLYSSKRMDIKRFTDDAPYTNGFPMESPGRAGVWIGWQIVREFMERNPEITVPQLMALDDSQKILNDSKYYPE